MDNKPLETMIMALKAAGYRLTPQRQAICRVLVESSEHPSAQMIFERLHHADSSLSLATVYNTLEALTRLGLINVLGEVGGPDPAIRYDADTAPHVNLACVRCQRIIDLPSRYVDRLDQEIEQNSGYALLGARVLYYGVCPDCQALEQANANPTPVQNDSNTQPN